MPLGYELKPGEIACNCDSARVSYPSETGSYVQGREETTLTAQLRISSQEAEEREFLAVEEAGLSFLPRKGYDSLVDYFHRKEIIRTSEDQTASTHYHFEFTIQSSRRT